LPPEVAVVVVIDEAAVVVRVGTVMEDVVNEISLPYEVPTLLTA
jgi:hypothetical protein